MKASKELQVLSAAIHNKDVTLIMGENPELFGVYQEQFVFVRDYFGRFREVPSTEAVEEKFDDIVMPLSQDKTSFYLDQLKSEFVRRRMEALMLKASDKLETNPSAKVLSEMITHLSKLGQYTANSRDVNLSDLDAAVEYYEGLKEKVEASGNGTMGIPTGFDSIDSAYTTGMAPGHSIVMFGFTGKGKSLVSALFALNAWLRGYRVLVVSLEMSPEEYRDRVFAMLGDGALSMTGLSHGDVGDMEEFKREMGQRLKDSPDFIVTSQASSSVMTPHKIQAKIDMYKPQLVVIDYLQIMSDNGLNSAMTPRMMNLSREIKLMAVANEIPIISISAVTDRENEKRDGPPLLSQMAWSSAIEYDANLAVAVHKHDESDIIEIVARKIRNGKLFACYLNADIERGIWRETFPDT